MSNSKSPVITKNLLKLLDDVSGKEEFNEEIKLIANSGIQFIDFELDKEINIDEQNEKLQDIYANITKNKFVFLTKENTVDSSYDDTSCTFARFHKKNGKYVIDDKLTDPKFNLDDDDIEAGQSSEDCPSVMDSVWLYNGIWFPILYYPKGHNVGPTNFARARITRTSPINEDDDKNRGQFHVTIAIDTKVDNTQQSLHGAPTLQDIDYAFTFRSGFEATELLRAVNSDGISFVDEWAKSIYEKVYLILENKNSNDEIKDKISKKIYQMHYLNVLAFLDTFFKPNDIKLVQFDKDHCDEQKIKPVSLILDVGNTRTCGLLVEEANKGADTFPNSTPLSIRDFNCPEYSYSGNFESKIQFQKANFDFNHCSALSSRLDAFVWPSLVRVGQEASELSSLLKGNEGKTGLISPKRSLWQLDKPSDEEEWCFNNCYYQIPLFRKVGDGEYKKTLYTDNESSKSAIYQPVTGYLNSLGDALFASADKSSCMEANFTGKSTMTFMLVEIILQAMMQMNSYFYRKNTESRDLPRRLSALVLTTPPSMPDVEKEIFRSCAYQALGIIWKAYGYDKTSNVEFHFSSKKDQMFPPVPEIYLKWDEVLSGQIVYLYNETQRIYGGKHLEFIRDIRRLDADGRFNEIPSIKKGSNYYDSVSARIASIDIGGGTTDLVIADYSMPTVQYNSLKDFKKKENTIDRGNRSIKIREVLKDGFKIAGDDLVYELLEKIIKTEVDKTDDSYWDKLFGDASVKGAREFQSRVQVVEKIFTKVAYRLISRLEQLDKIDFSKLGSLEVKVKGSIKDFVEGTEKFTKNELQDKNQEGGDLWLSTPDKVEFSESVKSYIKEQLGISSFEKDFLDKIELVFDLFQINNDISRGNNYSICKNLNYLNSIVNLYRCDVLLLTGRPTKIPGIRSLIERKSSLSARRIIPLHNYKCEGWYPSFDSYDGRIGDPKTSVVVGALLGYTKEYIKNKLVNFMLDIEPIPAISPMRYLGVLDRSNELADNEILYLFRSKAEENEQNGVITSDYVTDSADSDSEDDSSAKKYENFFKQYNERSFTLLTKPKTNTKEEVISKVTRELPCNLGYRQFNNSLFKAHMCYVLDTYDNYSELRSIKSIGNWYKNGEIEFSEQGWKQLEADDNLIGLMNKSKNLFSDNEAKKKIETVIGELNEFFNNKITELNNFRENEKNKENVVQESPINQATEASDKKKPKFLDRIKLFGAKKEECEKVVDQESNQQKQQDQDLQIQQDLELEQKVKDKSLILSKEFNRFVGKKILECKKELIKIEKDNLERIRRNMTACHEYQLSLMRLTKSEPKGKLEQNPIYQSIKFVCEEYENSNQENILDNIFILGIEDVKDKSVDSNSKDANVTNYINLKLQTVSSVDCEYWNNTGKI